jgi:hypothetical protein
MPRVPRCDYFSFRVLSPGPAMNQAMMPIRGRKRIIKIHKAFIAVDVDVFVIFKIIKILTTKINKPIILLIAGLNSKTFKTVGYCTLTFT